MQRIMPILQQLYRLPQKPYKEFCTHAATGGAFETCKNTWNNGIRSPNKSIATDIDTITAITGLLYIQLK